MGTSRIRNAFAVILTGALMAVASPAIASDPAPSGSWAPNPLPLSTLKEEAAAAPIVGLRNAKSGKFLQPTGNGTANGTRVVQQPGNDQNSSQYWDMIQDGNYFSFDNGRASRNLGIDGASTANGASAIIANPSGDANQDWIVIPVSGGATDDAVLQNRKSGKCLGIDGASTANGAQAAQFTCDGSENQRWHLDLL
ncbi:RICIN domain-containing protein [Streptomyces ipomoeae]|uniref:Ricin-type beta-trefoil lectin domain protein n=1 Tax=Streptomyces ipomoeae 91-03 TaxID=698759 RepID=L1KN93_9ACTN|nr:RICIN domain-containing protein [Streptomyces ipomoeae]EKX62029.1 ricin-type beta-trefoil lectin domain protein [Streptomyces ipomoeae 91-03]MDX2692338.1 RICIN domain-containing protein [Streptomyces ipomoeae]MDX2837832.1 RICIN domain-containing protein [Streptomyces ipomoeae]